MISIIFLLFFVSSSYASIGSEVAYCRACVDCQKGDWKSAQDKMSALVVDQPDNAELLYDNGVVAYRLHEFEKARAYFDQVTKDMGAPIALKKAAHFNLGNTQVALGKYAEAIEQYEAVLRIDQNDMKAQHNVKKVRELLQEQEQQQKESQGQNKSDDQQKGEQQKGEQQDSGGEQKQQDQQQSGGEKNKQSGQQQKSEQQDSEGRGSEEQSDSDSSERESEGSSGTSGGEQEKQGSDEQEEGKQEQQSDSESARQENQEEQRESGSDHASSSQEESDESDDESSGYNTASHHTKDEEKEQDDAEAAGDGSDLDQDRRDEEQKQLKQKLAPDEQWMAHVLQRREKADEHANKQLIRETVNKNMTGRHGQNNW